MLTCLKTCSNNRKKTIAMQDKIVSKGMYIMVHKSNLESANSADMGNGSKLMNKML